MGFYVNPDGMSKEEWLIENRVVIFRADVTAEEIESYRNDGELIPVCLVDNGSFTALAIAYSTSETLAFMPTANDQRPRYWSMVPADKINEANPHAINQMLDMGLPVKLTMAHAEG